MKLGGKKPLKTQKSLIFTSTLSITGDVQNEAMIKTPEGLSLIEKRF